MRRHIVLVLGLLLVTAGPVIARVWINATPEELHYGDTVTVERPLSDDLLRLASRSADGLWAELICYSNTTSILSAPATEIQHRYQKLDLSPPPSAEPSTSPEPYPPTTFRLIGDFEPWMNRATVWIGGGADCVLNMLTLQSAPGKQGPRIVATDQFTVIP